MSDQKPINHCAHCGQPTPEFNMKYCCRTCADKGKFLLTREIRKCIECDAEFLIRKKDTKIICSEECRKIWQARPENIKYRNAQIKKSVQEKYGVDNVFQLKETIEKLEKTKMEKYGNEKYNNGQKMLETKKEIYGEGYSKTWYKNMSQKLFEQSGVTHCLQLDHYVEKLKKTNLEKYGHESVSAVPEFQEKMKQTTMKNYGVEHPSQSKIVKAKCKETSFKNFGVSQHLQDRKRFEKHLKGQYAVKTYKETGITYQGSYELYFLEKIEEMGLIGEITNGESYKYIFEEKEHMYHSDFLFRGENIEIKSGWTYDNNGKNAQLKALNESKFQSVIDAGDKIIILKSKAEIDGFIKALNIH